MSTQPALIVSICAAAVALGSAIVAGFALHTARAAHALNERRDREETERREANEAGQARFVLLDVSFMGAPAVHIENGSPDPITAARIDSVECVSRPDLRVEANRNVQGASSGWDVIAPSESKMYPVILVDGDGQRDDIAGFNGADTWRIVASWTDVRGQRWRRTGTSDPERVAG